MSCDKQITGRENLTSNFTKFNCQTYVVHLYLCNHDNIIEIGWTNVKSLTIEEDIFKWYATGTLVFGDQFGLLQKVPMEMSSTLAQGDKPTPYKFRGDGKDILIVDIWPSTHETNGEPVSNDFGVDFKRWDQWLLHYRFAVYDVEDVTTVNNNFKTYKLYFWEEQYQKLLDQNMEWSTATSKFIAKKGLNMPIYRMNDEQRSIKTGEALVDLLQTAGLQENLDGDPDAPTNFDLGDEQNTIFYTSPSQNCVVDDLEYIADRHVGEKNQDLCMLQLDRSHNEQGEPKTFSFLSFSSYCKKAGKTATEPGELQSEHFFIYEPGPQNQDKTIVLPKAPLSSDAKDRDLKTTHYNTINSYKYVEMSGLDNATLWNPRPMYHYCRGKKQFVFDFWDHKPSVAKQHMIDNYLSQLYSEDSKDVLIHSNQTKIDATHCIPAYTHLHSLNGRKAHGRNRLVEAGIQLNACINFGVEGLTIRQPGRFIGIDRMHSDNDNDYDNRLCGQWFTTKVTHCFAVTAYVTHITAVKLHSFHTKTQLSEDQV